MVLNLLFSQKANFDYMKVLYNLIFFSMKETLDLLSNLVVEISGIKNMKINDSGYFLYCLSLQNDKMYNDFCYNKQDFITLSVVLINIVKLLNIIKSNYSYIQEYDDKEVYNRLGKVISIICQKKEIFWWVNNWDDYKGFILKYYNLEDLQRIDFDPLSYEKKLYIVNENGHAWLTDKKNKLKIDSKIRKVVIQPKLSKLLTTYCVIAETLKQYRNNPKYYCPWCNPNRKLLADNMRPRVKDECKQIWDFIVKYSDKYTDKYLNEHITHIKYEDLNTTIKERGNELLRIVNAIFDAQNAQNDQIFTENYNHIKETIKTRYNIEF